MTTLVKIALDRASNAQLKHYARITLGLDVPALANDGQLRSKILQANPATIDIEVPESMIGEGSLLSTPKVETPVNVEHVPEGRAGLHWRFDPKVMLTIMPTSDPTRTKDIPLPVNGEVFMAKRGERISLPYRFFLALDNAIEEVARETDEINPNTGLPMKEWVKQHSYPFQVLAEPSAEEIAAWHNRHVEADE